MSKEKLSLSFSGLNREIENILVTYAPSCQKTFMLSEYRLKLIAYVLIQSCDLYTVIIEDAKNSVNFQLLHLSSEQKLQIETLVKKGIYHILQENQELVCCIPQMSDLEFHSSSSANL